GAHRQGRRSPCVRRNDRGTQAQFWCPLTGECQWGEGVGCVGFRGPCVGVAQVRHALDDGFLLEEGQTLERDGDAPAIGHDSSLSVRRVPNPVRVPRGDHTARWVWWSAPRHAVSVVTDTARKAQDVPCPRGVCSYRKYNRHERRRPLRGHCTLSLRRSSPGPLVLRDEQRRDRRAD